MDKNLTMEKLVSLCKRRGFIFPGSEIYGGLANSWDFGPLGTELKNNIKKLWWERFVQRRDDIVGLDAALIMNTKVWEASGHLKEFSDPLVECKNCHTRIRGDKFLKDIEHLEPTKANLNRFLNEFIDFLQRQLDELNTKENYEKSEEFVRSEKFESLFDYFASKYEDLSPSDVAYIREYIKEIPHYGKIWKHAWAELEADVDVEGKGGKPYLVGASYTISDHVLKGLRNRGGDFSNLALGLYLINQVKCPVCHEKKWGYARQFNLMFKTTLGPVEDEKNVVYLRPETAQAMFVDFKQVLDTSRQAVPFGIAQIGKAFRNEITPGNFIFRTREFEQMEIEYFIPVPQSDSDWQDAFEAWRTAMHDWMKDIGLSEDNIHELDVPDGERAHYSKKTIDFEYDFPFGRDELYGLAYRGDFDLKNHFKEAPYQDPQTGEKCWPHVIEPTWGVERTVLAVLAEAYTEEGERTFLKIKPALAPYKAAVFPLLSNKPDLVEKAHSIYTDLRQRHMIAWDDRGNIGKRYYSQDEIGTPHCITVDFQTLEDDTVTVRDRDTAKQERVSVSQLSEVVKI